MVYIEVKYSAQTFGIKNSDKIDIYDRKNYVCGIELDNI